MWARAHACEFVETFRPKLKMLSKVSYLKYFMKDANTKTLAFLCLVRQTQRMRSLSVALVRLVGGIGSVVTF